MQWKSAGLQELSVTEFYAIAKLRIDIFVVEQNCPYPELDNKDLAPGVKHLCGQLNGETVAYARLLPAGVSYTSPSVGRVVVRADQRGTGAGHALMAQAVLECGRLWPGQPVTISAQLHLQSFYAQHGFQPQGDSYPEDDIPHICMVRAAEAQGDVR